MSYYKVLQCVMCLYVSTFQLTQMVGILSLVIMMIRHYEAYMLMTSLKMHYNCIIILLPSGAVV